MKLDEASAHRLARVRVLICDVDGTLTDGAMWYGEEGEVLKRFNTRDGHGIERLRAAGIVVALMTGEDSPIITARARKLRIEHTVLGCKDKGESVMALRSVLGVESSEVAVIGDDLGDLSAFAACGLTIAVADAEPEVISAADLVCERAGGHGAVRELADAILRSRQIYQEC